MCVFCSVGDVFRPEDRPHSRAEENEGHTGHKEAQGSAGPGGEDPGTDLDLGDQQDFQHFEFRGSGELLRFVRQSVNDSCDNIGYFSDTREGQFGKRDSHLEETDVGPKSGGASEKGARGADSARERGETTEGHTAVEETAPGQEGQRG